MRHEEVVKPTGDSNPKWNNLSFLFVWRCCDIATQLKDLKLPLLIQKCKHILCDECTTAYKKSLESLERLLKDLLGNIRVFGKALILFAGDFIQILPVVPRSTQADGVRACLKAIRKDVEIIYKFRWSVPLTPNIPTLADTSRLTRQSCKKEGVFQDWSARYENLDMVQSYICISSYLKPTQIGRPQLSQILPESPQPVIRHHTAFSMNYLDCYHSV